MVGGYAVGQRQEYLSLIARVLMGGAFIVFGGMKLLMFGPTGTAQYLASVWHVPAPAAAAWVAIIVEIIGGLAVLVGFKARWAAAVLALWCLLTGLGFHLPAGGLANITEVLKNLTMAGGFLYVIAYGPGSLSVDKS